MQSGAQILLYSHKNGFCLFDKYRGLISRRIIAWRLFKTLEAKWVVECVHEAKNLDTTKPLVLH